MRVLPDNIREQPMIHCFVSNGGAPWLPVHIAIYNSKEALRDDVSLEDRDNLTLDLWELVDSGEYTERMACTGFGIVLQRKEPDVPEQDPAAAGEAPDVPDGAGDPS